METTEGKPETISVGALTLRIKSTLNSAFRSVWVEGELSNVKYQSSGHGYFTLKDSSAQLPCAMFAGNLRQVKFKLADGMKVRALGDIDVYAPRGSYQLVVRKLEKTGEGDLMAKLEELKHKLQAEGLFAESHKRPLPLVPGCVGIVTSPTGAAIRDIFNVTKRRCPNMRIILAPAKVQGEGAKEDIVDAIKKLNSLPSDSRPDVLIVGRGGGSIEDLWCFNEEMVARAVYDSAIPVISAVGHEIDYTICDFVSDKRAPTPSAAAEIVAGRKDDFLETLSADSGRMRKSLQYALENRRARLERLRSHHVFTKPGAVIEQYAQRIDLLEEQMRNAVAGSVSDARRRISEKDMSMRHAVRFRNAERSHKIDALSRQIEALSPYSVFKRGYSVTMAADGRLLKSVSDVKNGDVITTRLSDGEVKSTVGPDGADAAAARISGSGGGKRPQKRTAAGASGSPQMTLF